MSTLKDRVVLITGASAGIGRATVKALLEQGARVAATARRADRLEELGRSLGVGPDRYLPVAGDVRSEADLEGLVARTLEWGGGLNALINNAGLSRGANLEGARAEDIRLMIDTNLFALANLTRLAIPALKKSGGDVINISSTAAKALMAGGAVYAATKAAVVAFSESLRKELAQDGVRVMTIYPGFVQTEFFDGFDAEKKGRLLDMMKAMDALQAEDLAETILFALTRPAHVALHEIVIRPTRQP